MITKQELRTAAKVLRYLAVTAAELRNSKPLWKRWWYNLTVESPNEFWRKAGVLDSLADSLSEADESDGRKEQNEAASRLVEKLEAVHADPDYQAVWACSQIHIGPYTGPTYSKELADLKKALSHRSGVNATDSP